MAVSRGDENLIFRNELSLHHFKIPDSADREQHVTGLGLYVRVVLRSLFNFWFSILPPSMPHPTPQMVWYRSVACLCRGAAATPTAAAEAMPTNNRNKSVGVGNAAAAAVRKASKDSPRVLCRAKTQLYRTQAPI